MYGMAQSVHKFKVQLTSGDELATITYAQLMQRFCVQLTQAMKEWEGSTKTEEEVMVYLYECRPFFVDDDGN